MAAYKHLAVSLETYETLQRLNQKREASKARERTVDSFIRVLLQTWNEKYKVE